MVNLNLFSFYLYFIFISCIQLERTLFSSILSLILLPADWFVALVASSIFTRSSRKEISSSFLSHRLLVIWQIVDYLVPTQTQILRQYSFICFPAMHWRLCQPKSFIIPRKFVIFFYFTWLRYWVGERFSKTIHQL